MKRFIVFSLPVFFIFSACSKERVIAKIGGDKITQEMLQERLAEAPQSYRGYLNTFSGKKQFLELMIRERIVIENAKRAGVGKKKDYLKSLDDFKKDQSRRLRDYEESLLMEFYVKDLHEKNIKASDKEIEQYYQDHMAEYEKPMEVKVRHILLSNRADAEQILKRVKSGEDFAKVARQMSTDPISAPRGGEIGPFRKGELVPEFEKAVFSLKLGEISPVVETQFGYHIIKKTDQKPLPRVAFKDCQQEIRRIVEKNKFDAWIEQAKKSYNLKINNDMLNVIPPIFNQEDGNNKIPQDTGKTTAN